MIRISICPCFSWISLKGILSGLFTTIAGGLSIEGLLIGFELSYPKYVLFNKSTLELYAEFPYKGIALLEPAL
jgi:hypothetical protein